MIDDWKQLGLAYPDPSNRPACAAFDLLAPQIHPNCNSRCPSFEWGQETTPSVDEIWELSKAIAAAVLAAQSAAGEGETPCPTS